MHIPVTGMPFAVSNSEVKRRVPPLRLSRAACASRSWSLLCLFGRPSLATGTNNATRATSDVKRRFPSPSVSKRCQPATRPAKLLILQQSHLILGQRRRRCDCQRQMSLLPFPFFPIPFLQGFPGSSGPGRRSGWQHSRLRQCGHRRRQCGHRRRQCGHCWIDPAIHPAALLIRWLRRPASASGENPFNIPLLTQLRQKRCIVSPPLAAMMRCEGLTAA